MNFGENGRINLMAKVGEVYDTASWSRIVGVKAIEPSPEIMPAYQARKHAVTESFRSYYNAHSLSLYKTRISLDDRLGGYVDVLVPAPALHYAINAMERQAFADDMAAGENPQTQRVDFILDLTPSGVAEMEEDFKQHRGLFKTYDYYVSPFASVDMRAPAQIQAEEAGEPAPL